MIVAVTQNSPESYLKFKKFNLLKRERFTFFIAPALLVGAGIGLIFLNGWLGVLCVAFGALLPAVLYGTMYYGSRRFLKRNGEYLATGTRFDFGGEEMTVTSMSPVREHCARGTFRYEEIYCLYETAGFFYFYLTKARALILPKTDFEQGKPEELSALLRARLEPVRKYCLR